MKNAVDTCICRNNIIMVLKCVHFHTLRLQLINKYFYVRSSIITAWWSYKMASGHHINVEFPRIIRIRHNMVSHNDSAYSVYGNSSFKKNIHISKKESDLMAYIFIVWVISHNHPPPPPQGIFNLHSHVY